MGRFGVRGADYAPPINNYSSGSSFSIQTEGYTFRFDSNFDDWATFTKEMKEHVATCMVDTLGEIMKVIGEEAIKRCPHYSGALEQAIQVDVPDVTSLLRGGRAYAVVGVSSSWKSSYDDTKAGLRHSLKSGESLARYLHEYYDTFIDDTKKGKKRQERKSAITGARVGSHFLLRAWTENTHLTRGFIDYVKSSFWSTGAVRNAHEINASLNQYAHNLMSALADLM